MIKDDSTLRTRFIGNIDYRNAKYQGEISDHINNCFGLMLDHNYTWVCSQWNQNMLTHCVAAIFADSSKLYGQILTQSKIQSCSNDEITVCQGQFYKIYIKNNVLVVDLQKYQDIGYHNLTKFIIRPVRDGQGSSQSDSKRMNLKKSPNYKELNRFQKKLQFVCQKDYSKHWQSSSQLHWQRQYMKILKQLLVLNELSINQINFELFLRNKKPFCQYLSLHESQQRGPQNHSFITVRLNENELSSEKIELKLLKQQQNQKHRGTEKCNLVKIECRSKDRNPEISKKYHYYANHQGYIAEQFVYGTDSLENRVVVGYVQYEYFYATTKSANFVDNFYSQSDKSYRHGVDELYSRPDIQTKKKCLKNLNEYYKKSLNFSNQFVYLTPVYTMQDYFIQLLRLALPIIQIQHINRKTEEDGAKNKQRQNFNRNKYDQGYSGISLNECGNIGRTTINASRIGDYIINNLVEYDQYQVSIEDVKKEILLTELKGSRRKSRVQTRRFRDSDEEVVKQEKKDYTGRKRKNEEVKQNNEERWDSDLQKISYKQKSEKRKFENQIQRDEYNANVLTGKIYPPSTKLNKIGTYVYYFENDPININSYEKNKKVPIATSARVKSPNVPTKKICPVHQNFADELFKSQLINEKFEKPLLMNFNFNNQSQYLNNQNKRQIEELANYYQQIQSQIHFFKKSKEPPQTEKAISLKKIKNSKRAVDKTSMNSSQKIENQRKKGSRCKKNKRKHNEKEAKDSPLKNQFLKSRSEESEIEQEQLFYKYPRQYPSQLIPQVQQVYFDHKISHNQLKQPSKIGNFFKYSPQKVTPKPKNSYIFGK